MNYIGTIIRPPSEADSIILQITLGCTHNKCSFCSAYKDKTFQLKDRTIISDDIDFASQYCKRQRSVFLADGDAIAIKTSDLLELASEIQDKLPWIKRINSYASPKSLLNKSDDELLAIRQAGVKRLYLGIESGSNTVLKAVNKGVTREEIIKACKKAQKAGFYLSTTVILGLGGNINSREHALETASILNEIHPKNISALTLMLPDDAPLAKLHKKCEFELLSPTEMLEELHLLISNICLDRAQFHANHASNYLPISGILNRDKDYFLELIESGIKGDKNLVPDEFRAL